MHETHAKMFFIQGQVHEDVDNDQHKCALSWVDLTLSYAICTISFISRQIFFMLSNSLWCTLTPIECGWKPYINVKGQYVVDDVYSNYMQTLK